MRLFSLTARGNFRFEPTTQMAIAPSTGTAMSLCSRLPEGTQAGSRDLLSDPHVFGLPKSGSRSDRPSQWTNDPEEPASQSIGNPDEPAVVWCAAAGLVLQKPQ